MCRRDALKYLGPSSSGIETVFEYFDYSKILVYGWVSMERTVSRKELSHFSAPFYNKNP